MTGTHPSRATGPALEAHYRLLLWLIPTVEKFPRSQKFLLGFGLKTPGLVPVPDLSVADKR